MGCRPRDKIILPFLKIYVTRIYSLVHGNKKLAEFGHNYYLQQLLPQYFSIEISLVFLLLCYSTYSCKAAKWLVFYRVEKNGRNECIMNRGLWGRGLVFASRIKILLNKKYATCYRTMRAHGFSLIIPTMQNHITSCTLHEYFEWRSLIGFLENQIPTFNVKYTL